MKGVFFGYALSAGCRLTDMYLVVPISEFDYVSLRESSAVIDPKVTPLHVKRII